MFQHRLSPSGLYLGNSPGFEDVGFLREVYFGAFPSADSVLDYRSGLVVLETFGIVIPTTWPDGGDPPDPPEPFDPTKLIYCIWTNLVAATDIQGGTPGEASMGLTVSVDSIVGGGQTIEEVMDDVAGTFSAEFNPSIRSVYHRQTTEIDIADSTKLTLFRPGTIPQWTGVPGALPWTAGATRHIYVAVNGVNETGVLVMPARGSRVLIQEYYGTISQHIGVAGFITPPGPP